MIPKVIVSGVLMVLTPLVVYGALSNYKSSVEFNKVLEKKAAVKYEPLNKFDLSPENAGKLKNSADIFMMFATGKARRKVRKMSKEFMAFNNGFDIENVAQDKDGNIIKGDFRISGLVLNRIMASVMGKFGMGKTDDEWR